MTPSAGVDAGRLGELLRPVAEKFGVDSSPAMQSLAAYADTLLRWNHRINLTGARDLDTLAREHLADAFAVAPHLPEGGCWVDVGSGGGLPGLVLAILRRDLQAVLVEPIQKRRAFLAAAVRELELPHVRVVGDRLDEHLERGGHGAYEFAVSRAVFPLRQWLESGRALVRTGGGIVVGLEGSARGELPDCAERFPYEIGFGERAIIRVRA